MEHGIAVLPQIFPGAVNRAVEGPWAVDIPVLAFAAVLPGEAACGAKRAGGEETASGVVLADYFCQAHNHGVMVDGEVGVGGDAPGAVFSQLVTAAPK